MVMALNDALLIDDVADPLGDTVLLTGVEGQYTARKQFSTRKSCCTRRTAPQGAAIVTRLPPRPRKPVCQDRTPRRAPPRTVRRRRVISDYGDDVSAVQLYTVQGLEQRRIL